MKTVKISFLGNEYQVKTDADEGYVRELAAYLEEKSRDSLQALGSYKVPLPLFLAMIKIADELFRLKSEYEEYRSRAEEKTRTIVRLLDSSLEESDITELEEESSKGQENNKPYKTWS
jgi:cell division protein ZapA (FtsZ GTPase activity inhibitor)